MKFRLRIGALVATLTLATLPLLASTRIVHHWVLPGLQIPRFQKILVAGILENYLVRQEFEDQMKTLLAKYGVEGVQSYVVLPPKNEMMEAELKQRIKESSLDSVLVVRPRALRGGTEEAQADGTYAPPQAYYAFWPYWNMAYGNFYPASSASKGKITVRVEFNLYNTKDEKLVWSGESGAVNAKDFEKSDKEFAQTLVDRLRKDKVIRKK